jgi:spore germination protein GerM
VVSEDRSDSDSTPVVAGQCAEDAPDCDDTAVNNGSGSVADGDTTTTTVASTTESATTTPSSDLTTVEVAFTVNDGECDDVVVYERQVDASADPIVAAFESLVAGPTIDEQASGAGSFFSAETTGMVASAVADDGVLVVNFDDLRSVIPNASTTCGSMALLAQLTTTAFQFDDVERVRYEIDGSCDTFAGWLQRECMEYTRDGAQPAQP